jgi:hypothetical protein
VVEALESPEGSDVRAFIDSSKSSLASVAVGFTVRFHEVAARPSLKARVPFAHGLPTLLRSWMDHVRPSNDRTVVYAPASKLREFNRFTDSVIARNHLENLYDVRRP